VRDDDGDSYPDARCCNGDATGGMHCGSDCDDARAVVHPAASEVCNGFDDNCDDMIDEGVVLTFYADCDGDGHGVPTGTTPSCGGAATMTGCAVPTGYATSADDCDDAHSNAYPGGGELCDGLDNDCSGTADDHIAVATYYRDHDGDTYVDATMSMTVMC